MHCDPSNLPVDQLAFARVDPGPDLDREVLHRRDDRLGASNRAPRPVEGRQETIPGSVYLPALEPSDLLPCCLVMSDQEALPRSVLELGCALGRAHDVGEQHR